MRWLEETHGIKFELVRHFLARMFDSEMFSTPGQWRTVAAGAFALALPAGMVLFDPWYMMPKPKPSAIPDELALVTLLTAVTGLLGLLAWQSLFPSRRDCLALAAVPVRPRQLFAARFTVVLLFSAALVTALNLLPSLAAPARPPSRLAAMGAQAASSGLACLFVLFAMVALQGVLLNVLPGALFARVSAYVQGALTAVLFLAALLSWWIKDAPPDAILRLPEFGGWAPPVWFLGLHETLLGSREPFFAAMARRGLLAAAAALLLAVLTYLLSYRRYRKLLLEAPAEAAPARARRWNLIGLLARAPRQRAVLDFIAKTLARSRVHRLIVLAYLGAATGILVNSSLLAAAAGKAVRWREILEFACLYWPLGLAIILLNGFRHVFSIPSELRANWIFRIAESEGRAEWMGAVERFVIVCVILPIHVIVWPVAAAVLGWPLAARMTVLQLLFSLSIFEILFYSWQQLPFTCSYVPGKRSLTSVLAIYIVLLGVAVPLLCRIIGAVSRMIETFLVYGAFFACIWIWLRIRRRDGWGEGKMVYDDVPGALPDLGLRG